MPKLTFEDITVQVRPHPTHEWALTSAEVAKAYEVSESVLRDHKREHADELVEGKHVVTVVENIDASGNHSVTPYRRTYWTKRGVLRLGFFIRSDRAKRFRDWAEDLIVSTLSPTLTISALPQSLPQALRILADQVEAREALELQLAGAQSKVEHYERTMDAEGSFTIADVAKMIGTGRQRLFDFLRAQNVLFYDRGHNSPYQNFLENGWFDVRQSTYQRGDKRESYPQLFVKPKGVEGIRRKWDAAHGTKTIISQTTYLPHAGGTA